MRKRIRNALAALFLAASLLTCGQATAADAQDVTNPITFREGRPLSLEKNRYKIEAAYRSVPNTPTYADGEVEIAVVTSQDSVSYDQLGEKNGKPIGSSLFYHNTANGDPNFYQLEDNLRFDDNGQPYMKGANGFRLNLEKVKEAPEAWTARLNEGQGSLLLLPKAPKLEYAFETKNGELIVVTSDRYNNLGKAENYQLYIGKPGELQAYNVTAFMRLRDGGTTELTAVNGEDKVHLISPASGNKPSTLNGELVKSIKDSIDAGAINIRGLKARPAIKRPFP